jgi:predicted phosphodiesterase
MLRVAILADTHGSLDPRIAKLVRGCDIAVHGGDIGGAHVLARLEPRGGRVYAVRGNNDVAGKWPEEEREAAGTRACDGSIRMRGRSSTATATGSSRTVS